MSDRTVRGLLLGKNPSHLHAAIEAVRPDAECTQSPLDQNRALVAHLRPVAKAASSIEDAKAAIEELIGDGSAPAISFVLMGGGFTQEDFVSFHKGATTTVPWYRPETTRAGYSGPSPSAPPSAEVVAGKIRRGIKEHVEDLRAGKGAGEVWYF